MEWIKENEFKVILSCTYLKNDFLPKNQEWKPWVQES